MRQRKRKDARRIAPPDTFRSDPIVPASDLEPNDPPKDWSELGRRVLAEAMRRSMREFRRRNGCSPRAGIGRGRAEGRS